ncbi:MAG: hypothetical protein WAZ18_04205 [Alphaproteobacteria bacterium]
MMKLSTAGTILGGLVYGAGLSLGNPPVIAGGIALMVFSINQSQSR